LIPKKNNQRGRPAHLQDAIMRHLEVSPATSSELLDVIPSDRGNLLRAMRKLVDDGSVRIVSRGVPGCRGCGPTYALTPEAA
jgi:hypothetical protein